MSWHCTRCWKSNGEWNSQLPAFLQLHGRRDRLVWGNHQSVTRTREAQMPEQHVIKAEGTGGCGPTPFWGMRETASCRKDIKAEILGESGRCDAPGMSALKYLRQ